MNDPLQFTGREDEMLFFSRGGKHCYTIHLPTAAMAAEVEQMILPDALADIKQEAAEAIRWMLNGIDSGQLVMSTPEDPEALVMHTARITAARVALERLDPTPTAPTKLALRFRMAVLADADDSTRERIMTRLGLWAAREDLILEGRIHDWLTITPCDTISDVCRMRDLAAQLSRIAPLDEITLVSETKLTTP